MFRANVFVNYKELFKMFVLIFCFMTCSTGFQFGASFMGKIHNGNQLGKNHRDRFHKGLRMVVNPPPFERGASFEFGGTGDSRNNGNVARSEAGSTSAPSSGRCSEMVRLNPCYFDNRRGCQHSNAICPIDGRRCSADRSYLDAEYGPRNIFEDFTILDAINEAAENTNNDGSTVNSDDSPMECGGADHLLYTYWGGDLSNNTNRDPDTPCGSHQELS